jgi:DNA-binding response OmpR family regulator
VADDDADIVRFVEIYLRLEGFEVVTARDGPDVLAKAVAVRPDLVLLDVLMPGLDGYAVCARIRADATLAAVPVIMVTANYVSADVEAARRVGADDFLVKPFDPVVLLDKVKALLGAATVSRTSRERRPRPTTGQGCATETAAGWLDHALGTLGLPRVVSMTDPRTCAAWRDAPAGMVFDHRPRSKDMGMVFQAVVYAITGE